MNGRSISSVGGVPVIAVRNQQEIVEPQSPAPIPADLPAAGAMDLHQVSPEHQIGGSEEQMRRGEEFLEGAPYDRVILTVGAPDILPAWVKQLRPGEIFLSQNTIKIA